MAAGALLVSCKEKNCGLYSNAVAQNPQALDNSLVRHLDKSVFDSINAGGYQSRRRARGGSRRQCRG